MEKVAKWLAGVGLVLVVAAQVGCDNFADPDFQWWLEERRAVSPERPRAILWYGNSFTSHHEVWKRFADLAEWEGHPRPLLVLHLAGGRTTDWHLQQTISNATANVDAPQVASVEGGFTDVVIQGQSMEATPIFRFADPGNFLDSTERLFALVRASPNGRNARCVLYETWARHPEHADYVLEMFKDADDMQTAITRGYDLAAARVAARFGSDAVVVAPCGRAYQRRGFARELYDDDFYHQSAVGADLLARTLYETVYGCGIAPR